MISAASVDAAFRDALYRDEELSGSNVPDGAVIVEGVQGKFGFNPARLAKHEQEVREWLADLPTDFRATTEGGGGGWSFLQACMTKDDEQWGEHMNIDQLFALGQGLGLVRCLLPREVWSSLPGEMPYYEVALNSSSKSEGSAKE